jgi:hypothetical protein
MYLVITSIKWTHIWWYDDSWYPYCVRVICLLMESDYRIWTLEMITWRMKVYTVLLSTLKASILKVLTPSKLSKLEGDIDI